MGNALRSISLRVRSYDEETEQLSEDLMDIKGKVIDLTKAESNNGKGISLFTDETQTQYKDLVVYLGEIADVMDEISAKDKQELLELLFGKQRANAGAALLTNFDQVYNVIETIKDSSGSAEREMSTMMESISYKINQFKETLVGIAQGLFSQGFMKSMVDSGTRVLNVFDDLTPSIGFILKQFANLLELVTKLADTIGGIPLLIAGIGLKNVGNIKTWISDLKQVTMAVDSFKNIAMSFEGTGLKAVIDDITVTKYATSIKGLTLEQANLALSTTQLSATEKERVLVEAGLIAQTEALTATDAVYRLQQKLGNDLSAEEILISAGLVTQKEIEDGTTIKLTADKLKEALATGKLSLENYKLIASIFGVEGANYGATVSFEVLTKAIWANIAALAKWLVTNPVGWAILAAGAIAATVAIVDHFTISLEESKEQLKDLKDECKGIETDLDSINDELKTTVDRMKELEGKDTLTFTEKEEYDNLVKTNNELQRKIDLLELEQEINNREKNKTFVQTMVKDTEDPFEYEVNPDGKSPAGQYSISDEYLTNETGYIKAQFEIRKNLLDELSKAETKEERDRIQERIDEIDSFLQSKNKEWSEIAQDISYIPNPTTEDEKAVNEWLDYINDFQDKMAIELGRENAKTNAFNRLIDNWQFDGVVQGLQDLGKEGKVTAKMLNDPKYDEFIQKLVEIGVIDSADNLDDIALAFNNFKEKVEPTTNAVKTAISSTQELLAKYDDVFSNQSKIQSAFDKIQEGVSLTSDEVRELVALCPALAGKFKELANGYSISGQELIDANKEMTDSVIQDITKQRDELVKILNTPMSVNSASDAKIAQDYFAEVKTQIESLDLILSMLGINVQNTEDKFGTMIDNTSNKIKAITSAMEEMADTGYITSSTYKDIAELGGNFTDCLEYQNGKLVLNVDKLKDLEIQQLATAKSANSLAISELELKAASLAAHGQDFSDIQAQIESLMEENAVYTQLQEEIRNAKPDEKKSNTKDEEPASVTKFKKDLAEKEHLLNTNQITEQEYYDWLDDESKRVYGNLKDYEEDLWKYEEQVYQWRQEQEEKFFDKKIENYKKLSDNALDDKITDFNVVDQKALDDLKKFNEEMQKAYGLGNVDLTKRPKVNADTMRKAGYEVDDGGTATVYSSFDFLWQGDEENGKYVAVHYTPILPDGTVLDEKTLSDYLYGTLEGSQDILSADNLGVVLKVDTDLNISDEDVKSLETDKPTKNIQDIIKACDDWDIALHNVQEQWVELDNVANQSTTSYANKFDYAREQINSAIAETQNRINELSLKTGFEDEISDLKSDLEDLYDDPKDISEKEYNFNISLIDDDIDDLNRKYEKTLDPQYLDDIERLYADKKTVTQNRINELISQGYSIESEEIRKLYNDLEDIDDKIDDTFERKVDAEKDYINKLKDDYSDMIDERIDEYKKLSETIEDTYDKQIKAIDKQIKALDKKNEQEERQKDILEKQKSVREAQLALEKASIKNRYVYVNGGWEARADEEAVAKAEKDLQKAKDDLQKEYQEDVKSKLEEQKEILETQKSDSKGYYDKIVSDLETQKSARKKQYDILVDIYDEISGGKTPTSSNDSLIEKLNNSVDIKEAIDSLSPEEIKQAVASGLLVADNNGDYTIDYSVLNKNEEAVKDNTAELEKLNNKLDEATQTDLNTNVNPNLDGEGYLVGADGKRILSNGKPIKALSKSEWEKRHTTDEWSPKDKDVESMTMEEYYKKLQNGKSNNTNTSKKSFAGYETMKGLINAMMTGAFTIPTDTANRMMNSNINSRIGENIAKMPEYINNVVNSTPNINIINNIDGNPDQKTIAEMNKNIESALIKYTDQMAAQAKNIFFKKMYS